MSEETLQIYIFNCPVNVHKQIGIGLLQLENKGNGTLQYGFFFLSEYPSPTNCLVWNKSRWKKKTEKLASEPVVGRCPNKRKQMLKHSKGTWDLKAEISVVITT